MSAQPETTERIYALEKLMGDRAAILKDSTELLTNRAKIDKYREKNLPRAQDAYLELQKTQKRILESLRDAQHDLLEMEEDALASTAEKLYQGFSGFNLMSRNYEPVYKVLTGFAEQLPESQDTVNAQVIGRLMNNVRMGYYPTDPENIECILRGIKFPAGVTTNVFDPCCGCGKALRQIANGNNCFAYGVELDELRAEEAQNRLHRVGIGSFFFSRISREAMHLMFLNPPYLNVLTEGGNKTRYEKRFLMESMGHLMIGGVLIYVIPYYRLTADICRILSDNFTDLGVWRFTDKEFSKFKQVAIIGIRKKRDEDPDAAAMLESLSYASADIPVITEIEEDRYPVPGVEKAVEVFKGEKFNEKELERQLLRSDSIQRMMNAKSELDRGTKHPLLPLSIGQIGLVGGSGMINGLIECDTPHVIKGRIVKVKNAEREELFTYDGEHKGAEIKETVSNRMIFNVLTPQGFRSLA
ncbi:MAG: class I SAM-dependent methyltransferase [Oscillospiraceae bacterium]|nr:class I SAM-dependent methyltransferase [Oscillospiraceae bacterium]